MAEEKTIMKKQIMYVGFYSRLLAVLIDIVVAMIVFYPVFLGIAWLSFGTSNPMQDMGPIIAPSLKDARSFPEIIHNLRHNDVLLDYLTTHNIWFKVGIQYVLQAVLLIAFIGVFWKYKAATPGKMLLSMRIVDAKTFETPSNKQYVLRLVGYVISLAVSLLGFLWIAVDKRKQGWHDKLAGTVVIKA